MSKILIKDIAKVKNGSTPSTKRDDYYGGEIMWITPKDLSKLKSKYIEKGEKSITQLGYNSCSTTLVPNGSILLSSRAPIGLLAIAKNEVCTNQGFKNLVIDTSRVSSEYLYYWLKTKVDYIGSLGTGTTFKEVSKYVIENLEIQLPNLPTQKAIAKVLSDLDAKIALNNKINSELEAMAKTLYDYWFVQFDFPDKNGKPYKTSGGKIVFNEELKREIPEGWEVRCLGDCIKIFDSMRVPLSRAEREKIEGSIPYYGATSVMGYVNDFIFDDEYILLAEDGSVMDKNGNPIVQFIWGKTWVNNHAHVIQAENKLHNEFIFQLVKMIHVVLIKTGSIQMKINQENLKKHKVLIPTTELMDKFSIKTISIRKQLINNIEQNQKLAELRDWLLPMLMNGQVTVGEAEEKVQMNMAAEPRGEYKKGKV